ncbi:MAG: hypothetical protein QOK37_1974 [Thermoanaerobaculia bacterium]|jgi:hypothetical protein|nr:hypothetical protein [Thermoanaerobaculia bacterium]
MKPVTLALVVLLAAAGAFAQPAGFEKVLFPIVIHPLDKVPGAFGTSWITEVSVLNAGSVPVPLAGEYACFICRTAQPLQPGVTYGLVPISPRDNVGGSFLLVDSRYADQLRYGLRVRDVSREAEGFGSEVPVVRARDFRGEGVSLLGVPNQPNLRLTLRVYALDAGGVVAVRIFEQRTQLIVHLQEPMPADLQTAERTYTLAPVGTPDPANPDANFPAYAQASDLPMPSTGLARIDVVPLTPGMRIWAFASVTNNTTQQVTVISPH